ncbi:MAG: polyketide cyclase [Rhizobiales bacterium PAR1]|nr:MAG: polyketide cyclase [Rhizobiales bacterium PAR1]
MGAGTIILFVILAVLAVIILIAWQKPNSFRIERKDVIAAPMDLVFAQINDLVVWQAWSPWAKKDPNARTTFSAVTAGRGASFRWEGNREVGTGSMTIIEETPASRVVFRLDFEKPFKATNTAEFTLRPTSTGTEVVWAMFGPQPLPARVMCLFMNMDAMVGKDFEAGLASLKAICEKQSG